VDALLGHASNDSFTQEFIITTPQESTQKDWIGGTANHTHTVVLPAYYQ
jgi:hypothetical protein